MYSINEEDGSLQIVLVLSRPSSTDITVQIRDNQNTATSEYNMQHQDILYWLYNLL